NGRIEQFLPSTTLKNEDIRNQEILRRIGRLMAQLHLKVPTGKVIPEGGEHKYVYQANDN
ncbi:3053_t:CDS:1, partial [Paraglomus brasilianum]